MMEALQITIIGMGLVFTAILLLWGMMAILVRVTADPSQAEKKFAEQEIEEQKELARKRRAAVAAVAIAHAQLQSAADEIHEFPLPPTPLVSAWQAVLRTRMVNKRRK
jgi:Na+-transporting methylmalonyl-CoA/oxaloacetate decarboxylase gamma subunit